MNRAVRANLEPVLVIANVRVIGRALEGDVESDLKVELAGFRDEVPKVLDAAERGMDGFVTAFLRANGPWAARVIRAGGEAIVRAFAERFSDRMNGRKIQNVEGHLGDLGQDALAIAECADGPREHFIPRAEAGQLGFDQDLEVALVTGRERVLGKKVHQFRRPAVEGRVAGEQTIRRFLELPRFKLRRARGGSLKHLGSRDQFGAEFHAGLEFLVQVAVPGLEMVDPGLDGVRVQPEFGDGELTAPAVIHQRLHQDLRVSKPQHGGDHIMPVSKNVGFDDVLLADGTFDRESPCVNFRFNAFDNYPLASFSFCHTPIYSPG